MSIYTGQKNISGVIQKIVNQIPPCTDFYEPFAGSAAVSIFLSKSINKDPTVRFHLNDIDSAVTARFDYPTGSTVTNEPAILIIQSLKTVPAVPPDIKPFIFCDPPYHHDTRPYATDLYNYEMSNSDHVQFLLSVRTMEQNVMIIHPVHKLYNTVLEGWRKLPVTIRYHKKTSHELLYMNYPGPLQLLTYVAAGKDCWDRQRIKRKGDRFIADLERMPPIERNYLLDRLNKTNFEL